MQLFRKIWAFYAVILFITMMIISIPILLFNMVITPGKKALHNNIWFLHHVFTPVFLTLILIKVKVKGAEKIKNQPACIIVSNHRSALDFIINAHAFPGIFRFLAKQELLKVPVFGWVVGKMCLIVDRSSRVSRANSMLLLKKELEAGVSIFIYPEGGRNRTDEPLARFYDGAFKLAIQTGAPIAVQTIVNIRDISNSALSVDLRPGTVEICWDQPIETKHLGDENAESLKQNVANLMLQHLAAQTAPMASN